MAFERCDLSRGHMVGFLKLKVGVGGDVDAFLCLLMHAMLSKHE